MLEGSWRLWHVCDVPTGAYRLLWMFFGTNAKCRPRRAMSEFGGKAEDIYSVEHFVF